MTQQHPCTLPKSPSSKGYKIFFSLSSRKSPLFSQTSLLLPCPLQLVFWQIGMGHSCAFKISFLKNVQPVPKDFLNHCPELAKVCPLLGQGRSLVNGLSSFTKNWKLAFCGRYAQDSLWPPHHPQSFSVHKQWGLPSLAHTHHLCEEIVFHTVQKSRVPPLCCAVSNRDPAC